MITPSMLYEAEEWVRQLHKRRPPRGGGSDEFELPTTVRGAHRRIPAEPSVPSPAEREPILELLEAVARGEVSPQSAYQLLTR
jgi:hypothetical protein